MHNNERIIRRTNRALSWVDFALNRRFGLHQPRSKIKRAQRFLKEARDAALHAKSARKHARRKRLHARTRGTGKDVPIMSDGADHMDSRALESRPHHPLFDPESGLWGDLQERPLKLWRFAAWKRLCKGTGRDMSAVPHWAYMMDPGAADLFYPNYLRSAIKGCRQEDAPERPAKVRQCDANEMRMRAYIRGNGKDVSVMSLHGSIDHMALEYPDQCPFDLDASCKKDWGGTPCTFDEDFGVCLQLAGGGWKVVAAFLGSAMVQYSVYGGQYKGDNCYFLAINPVTAQAIISPFYPDYYSEGHYDEGCDGLMYTYSPDDVDRPALLGMERALISTLSPRKFLRKGTLRNIFPWVLKLSCVDMMGYAESKVDPVDLALQRQLQHQARYSEAVAALYATFMWTCPQVLLAGPFSPWRVRVWTPKRVRGIVRLQACVRGWLLRRELYSLHIELGQRRLQLMWASFKDDY